MTGGFWLRYAFDMVVVALLLGGLYFVVRSLAQGRVLVSTQRRLVTVLESTILAQHSTVHVVKVGNRYYLVGAGNGQVATLGELPAEEVDAWLKEQRALYGAQAQSLTDALKFLRGKS
jgi:flagellar biogenesis protein FliO